MPSEVFQTFKPTAARLSVTSSAILSFERLECSYLHHTAPIWHWTLESDTNSSWQNILHHIGPMYTKPQKSLAEHQHWKENMMDVSYWPVTKSYQCQIKVPWAHTSPYHIIRTFIPSTLQSNMKEESIQHKTNILPNCEWIKKCSTLENLPYPQSMPIRKMSHNHKNDFLETNLQIKNNNRFVYNP
jgi:hypothetical protein